VIKNSNDQLQQFTRRSVLQFVLRQDACKIIIIIIIYLLRNNSSLQHVRTQDGEQDSKAPNKKH